MNQSKNEPKTPPSFSDSAGRTWTVKLTLDLLDSVQAATQIDLAPPDHDVSAMTNLLFDPRKLGVVLWECCKKQAEANSVSRESFLEAMDGDALASGWGAVVDAIVFFTRSRSQPLAETIQKAIEAQMRVIETGAAAMQKAMDGQRTAAAIQGAASKLEIELEETIEKACASFATS